MKILQIHPFLASAKLRPRTGGTSGIALRHSQYLLEHGHKVAVFPWPEWIWGEPMRFAVAEGAACLTYAPLALPLRSDLFFLWRWLRPTPGPRGRIPSRWMDLCFLTGFRNAIREFHPDVIHVHRSRTDIPRYLRLLGLPHPLFLTIANQIPEGNPHAYQRIIVFEETMRTNICGDSGYPAEKIAVFENPLAGQAAADRYGQASIDLYHPLPTSTVREGIG